MSKASCMQNSTAFVSVTPASRQYQRRFPQFLLVRVLILHLPRQREQAFEPLGMDAGLAQRQGIAEQLAATGSGPRLGRGDLSPEGIAPLGGLFDGRLAQRRAGVRRRGGSHLREDRRPRRSRCGKRCIECPFTVRDDKDYCSWKASAVISSRNSPFRQKGPTAAPISLARTSSGRYFTGTDPRSSTAS